MGCYTRVLTAEENCIPVKVIEDALRKQRLPARIELEAGDADAWEQLVLKYKGGSEIAAIERNPVKNGSLGQEEIGEFLEDIKSEKPDSAVDWLQEYLPSVRCIYAFQHLRGADEEDGFECLSAVSNAIWSVGPAILQADGEGFSNEDGYHILWQFSDSVTGEWWMGILQNGKWVHFLMDLGNQEHRKAFLSGQVPEGVKLA